MDNASKKLRVGLLMNSFDVRAWTYAMLARIKLSDYAEIVLVVLNDTPKPKKNFFSKIAANKGNLLFTLYNKVENMVNKPVPNAFEKKEATELLADIPVLKVKPIQTKYSDRFEDSAIEEIKKYKLDVLVRLGFRILRGKILESSRYGVWSYHHGDNKVNRGSPAGFWEVFENHPMTGSMLQILTDDLDCGRVLCRSYSASSHSFVNRNQNQLYWKSLSFLPRKLEELHRLEEEKFFRKVNAENKHLDFYSNRLYTAPKNSEIIRLLPKRLAWHVKNQIKKLVVVQQWILLFDLRDGLSSSLWRFKKIIPPKDRFWADPYVLYKNGQYYIFIEDFEYAKNKGDISLIMMNEKGEYSKPIKVLERPYHLSHPFVFEWEGDYYMIPESAEKQNIEVYKCTKFPDKWAFHKTLMENICAVDATLFNHQGKWCLFAGVKENDGAPSSDELFVFYSDSPLSSDWKSHPQNPIVSDVRRARPAGKIIEYNGNIYRPSQDNSHYYGYRIKINQIVVLNETEYKEKEVSSLEAGWDKNIIGLHTFNYENRLTMIDGLSRKFRLF